MPARACSAVGTGPGQSTVTRTPVRFELAMERFAEGEHVGLAGVIDRPARPRHESRQRSHVEDAASAALEAVDEGEREIGKRAHVQVDDRELFGAVELVRGPDEPGPGVVDNHLRLEAVPLECRGDYLRRIGARDIRGNDRRPRQALGRDRVRQRHERRLTPGNEDELVTGRQTRARAPRRSLPRRR